MATAEEGNGKKILLLITYLMDNILRSLHCVLELQFIILIGIRRSDNNRKGRLLSATCLNDGYYFLNGSHNEYNLKL